MLAYFLDKQTHRVALLEGEISEQFKAEVGAVEIEVEFSDYIGGWFEKGYAPKQPISELRTAALSRIDSATSAAILAGFDYEIDTGEGAELLHFSYDSFDQQNFADTANVATLSLSGQPGLPTSVMWNAYRNYTPETGGELVRIEFTPQTFLGLYMQGALAHKGVQMEIGGQRKAAVEAAQTVEEIQALLQEWGLS